MSTFTPARHDPATSRVLSTLRDDLQQRAHDSCRDLDAALEQIAADAVTAARQLLEAAPRPPSKCWTPCPDEPRAHCLQSFDHGPDHTAMLGSPGRVRTFRWRDHGPVSVTDH